MKDYVAKARLLKLADLLCTLRRKQFNYGEWGTAAEGVDEGTNVLTNPESCGTRACALGWTPALPFAKRAGFALVVGVMDSYTGIYGPYGPYAEFKKKGLWVPGQQVAYELFGLTEYEFQEVFMPGTTNDHGQCSPEMDATPKAVAKHIRAFVSRKYGASAKRSG